MDVVVERVAGLDIGKSSMTVCVRTPGPGGSRTNEVRTYSTMTRQIQAMAAWLLEPVQRWRDAPVPGGLPGKRTRRNALHRRIPANRAARDVVSRYDRALHR